MDHRKQQNPWEGHEFGARLERGERIGTFTWDHFRMRGWYYDWRQCAVLDFEGVDGLTGLRQQGSTVLSKFGFWVQNTAGHRLRSMLRCCSLKPSFLAEVKL